MKIDWDILKYSVSNLFDRKLRSTLSILSILMGIAAIFALVSFGQGIGTFMDDFAKTMGTDKLMIMPRDTYTAMASSSVKFTEDDLDFIRKTNGVSEAAGMIIGNGKIKFKNYKERYSFVIGIPTESTEKRLVEEMLSTVDIMDGRNLKKGDVMKVVLGYSYMFPNKLFKKPVSVGDKVEINDMEVEVVGFYEAIGNPQDDSQMYLTLEGAKMILDEEDYLYVMARVAPDQNPTLIADKLEESFRKHRGQEEGEEDFFIQTFEELMATYATVITIINAVLFLIALISVVVAAVNIANTMYTSILERTSEIGVMKAVGAKNSFIMFVFMLEAGILGLIGGIIGILIGYGAANIGGYIAEMNGLAMLKPAFPLWLIIGCLLFAVAVGALSGLMPAIRASKLKPVEALRYE